MNHFPSNVKLLSTQRFIEGGKSTNNFENFNLALHVNDNSDRVLEKCRPRPEEAPVTRATFPLKSKISVVIV